MKTGSVLAKTDDGEELEFGELGLALGVSVGDEVEGLEPDLAESEPSKETDPRGGEPVVLPESEGLGAGVVPLEIDVGLDCDGDVVSGLDPPP
jgi:hypothetical protein